MKKIYFLLVCLFCVSGYIQAQFVTPTVCTTETFTVSTGDIVTDPTDGVTGGPGGDCTTTSSGDPGDYPNAGCVTTTTYCSDDGSAITLDFTSFGVFATFDWLIITCADGTELFNNMNDGTIQFFEDLPTTSFTCPDGCITLTFNTTTVVSTCGWEASVTTAGGGGGGATCDDITLALVATINTAFPEEINFELLDGAGAVVFTGDVCVPGVGTSFATGQVVMTNFTASDGGTYTLNVLDDWGDGTLTDVDIVVIDEGSCEAGSVVIDSGGALPALAVTNGVGGDSAVDCVYDIEGSFPFTVSCICADEVEDCDANAGDWNAIILPRN